MSLVASTDLAALATGFSRSLRASGLDAPPSATIDFAEALALLGTSEPAHVFWAGQACFCRRREDIEPYAQTFAAYFRFVAPIYPRGRLTTVPPVPIARPPALVDNDDAEDGGVEDTKLDEGQVPPLPVAYSASELLRTKDFALCSEAEFAEAQRLMATLRVHAPLRRGRRLRASHDASRGVLDVRRTLKRSLATSGDPVRLARRVRGTRPRRVVFLLDVSGSMSPYARATLRFAHSTILSQRSVEAFTLGTRCTRVTRQLSWRDPDAALARVAASAPDLEGGTRLGECLREFNESWGLGGIARGATVVFVSDGWDRGDPSLLATQMARLANVAHRVIWVNPLRASPGYEPLVRGMAAALPFTDEFLSGDSVNAFDQLAQVMSK
ncbi:MAG TPA: VWA domain-containing protein [Acidimicrobiales bacterium]|nr:VWA domain-containing protein [Acidimicrobiales bacterium]